MITCKEVDGVAEALCDLTRQMPGIDRIREATALLERAEYTRLFIMQWRAAAVADLHYLEGMSLRGIAPLVGNAFQGVSQWLQVYGPTNYLLVRKEGRRPAELKVIDVAGEETKKKIKTYRDAGFRVAPTTLNLLDGATIRAGVDPEALWQTLGETEPADA
jgi:hypothetical protein